MSKEAPPALRIKVVPRPERYVVPVATAVILLLAWAAVADASGSGWVQAIGAVAAGVVFVGMVCPAAAAVRLQVRCISSPRDAIAGDPIKLEIESNVPLRVTPVRPGGTPVVVPWDGVAWLSITPPTRGVIHTVRVRVATAAPLGLLWWRVERILILPSPMEVAPAAADGWSPASTAPDEEEGKGKPAPSFSGNMRGVRPYAHGDSPRLVHWRASAHTSTLMVRENEHEPDLPVKLVVDLPAQVALAEIMAGRAVASVTALLRSGRRVLLETTEGSGRVSAAVTDPRTAGRRLARAGNNPYSDLDPGRQPVASAAFPVQR